MNDYELCESAPFSTLEAYQLGRLGEVDRQEFDPQDVLLHPAKLLALPIQGEMGVAETAEFIDGSYGVVVLGITNTAPIHYQVARVRMLNQLLEEMSLLDKDPPRFIEFSGGMTGRSKSEAGSMLEIHQEIRNPSMPWNKIGIELNEVALSTDENFQNTPRLTLAYGAKNIVIISGVGRPSIIRALYHASRALAEIDGLKIFPLVADARYELIDRDPETNRERILASPFVERAVHIATICGAKSLLNRIAQRRKRRV